MEKKKKIFNIIISLLFGFQQFFFFPMEIYYSDKLSFALASKFFAIPMLILTLLVCGIVFVILWLFLKKSEKVHKYISLLLMGYIFASYIQAMFLNGKMGKITGEYIVDYDDVNFITYNLEIFLVLMILPFIICFIKNKYIGKLKKIINCNVAIYLFTVLFFMQFMGYVSNYVKFYSANKSLGKRIGCFSYEPTMHLSDKENIIVFLTDKLDDRIVDKLIEDYPELNEYFKGFTYYKDNCSYYAATYPSVVSLFSKTKLEDIGKEENYTDVVWENENLLDILKKNNYEVYLHMDHGTTYNTIAQVEKKCDNAISKKLGKDAKVKYNIIIKTMVKFSFLRSMPYIAKGAFVLYSNADFANDFIGIDYEKYPEIQKQMVGTTTDLAFYNYLKENKLKADNDNKIFSFVHLNGSHDPSDEEANLYEGQKEEDLKCATARGEFEILYEYIKQMKELGIYDNSTIIILADHDENYGPLLQNGNISEVYTSALFIKEKNAEIVPLKIDEDSQMSNDFFYDSVLEYAGIENKGSGYTYQFISQNDSENIIRDVVRMYGDVYEVTGNARDIRNWKRKE